MEILIPKIAAYLIDKTIMLPPDEAPLALQDNPRFAGGIPLKYRSQWDERDLYDISRRFWAEDNHKYARLGYRGAGVEKVGKDYRITLFGDERTCHILGKNLPFLQKKCMFRVCCDTIEQLEFATSSVPSFMCEGGWCILQPSKSGTGILGAWLDHSQSTQSTVGVTNNHVAVEYGSYQIGTKIYDFNNNKIGTVQGFVPLEPYTNRNCVNLVDFAWIKPHDNSFVDYCIGCLTEKPKGEIDLEKYYVSGDTKIHLCSHDGQRHKHCGGDIIGVLTSFYVGYSPQFCFEDVLMFDIGEKGDSGALVLKEKVNNVDNTLELAIGGILFAVSNNQGVKRGYANKWEYVKSETGFNFVY